MHERIQRLFTMIKMVSHLSHAVSFTHNQSMRFLSHTFKSFWFGTHNMPFMQVNMTAACYCTELPGNFLSHTQGQLQSVREAVKH